MDQVKNTADNAGVGPNDSSTASGVQAALQQGIETAQNAIFGQGAQQPAEEQPKHDPKVADAVDSAKPESVEEFQRHQHKSEPVAENGEDQ